VLNFIPTKNTTTYMGFKLLFTFCILFTFYINLQTPRVPDLSFNPEDLDIKNGGGFKAQLVNYLGASPRGIYRKNIKNSRQASEHSNLDYRVNKPL
jgi:hypothetical protein